MAGYRRGDLKRPPQNLNVKEADKPHITQTLLMRAGDVESNPGPKRKHMRRSEREEDFDNILKDVARLIRSNIAIDTLGKALGFDPAEIGRYIATNTRDQSVTYYGTLEMLRDWRDDQTEANERPALADALRQAGLKRLADIFLRTSKVPDLQTASDDLSLEDDLLESVVNDTMKYYISNMCTIQADPTNNDVMFEFDHIYTNPTLLEEDRNNKTTRKPLLFRNLLNTKVNGHLPNRLLVQAECGAGKTTFCTKIAQDWVLGIGFQQFKLVAVIPLCKAKNKTVGDVIKSYLSDNNPVTAVQIDNYILSNPKHVFLVFDGLDELRKFSDLHQIVQIILNRLFMSGTVLVTSRQWRVDEIRSITELKKVYAFIYIEEFSVDNVAAYITKFFHQDAASSQELIDFITSNDVIAVNMAPFPIYIAMLCIMWREYDGERREAMSKLMTFSQLFGEMVDFLVDHCGSKDDSQTGPTVQELRQMIPDHLKAIGKIAFQGILDGRREFPEDTFQSCRESMEMSFKVGVLTREKHATPRRDRRKSPHFQVSIVRFSHTLLQEFMAAQYLAQLHSSDHDKYERIMANILENKEKFRYLLYFTSAQGKELGQDIMTRLIAQETKDHMILDGAFGSKFHPLTDRVSSQIMRSPKLLERTARRLARLFAQEMKEHFIVDVAYESQHQSVAKKVRNQLPRSRKTLAITDSMSTHTISGWLFIMDPLGEVDSLVLKKPCDRTASQSLAEFILSSTSLRTMVIGKPMHAVFYSMLADNVQQCQIEKLMILDTDLSKRSSESRDLAQFICNLPQLQALRLDSSKLHKGFYKTAQSMGSSAKGNNQSTALHTSLRELKVDYSMVLALQSCGDMFNSVENLSICFWWDFKCDFIQRVHGFQGVRELSIVGRLRHKPYRVTGEPSTMFKHLVRVFPQLIKMTFRIHLSNAILKQILGSLRETRVLPLKSVRVLRCGMDDGLDELSALINRINDENVFRVEMKPLREETPEEHGKDPYFEGYKPTRLDFEDSLTEGGSDEGFVDDDESGDESDDQSFQESGVELDDGFNDDSDVESDEHSFPESADELIDEFNNDDHIESDEHSFHESGVELDDDFNELKNSVSVGKYRGSIVAGACVSQPHMYYYMVPMIPCIMICTCAVFLICMCIMLLMELNKIELELVC